MELLQHPFGTGAMAHAMREQARARWRARVTQRARARSAARRRRRRRTASSSPLIVVPPSAAVAEGGGEAEGAAATARRDSDFDSGDSDNDDTTREQRMASRRGESALRVLDTALLGNDAGIGEDQAEFEDVLRSGVVVWTTGGVYECIPAQAGEAPRVFHKMIAMGLDAEPLGIALVTLVCSSAALCHPFPHRRFSPHPSPTRA